MESASSLRSFCALPPALLTRPAIPPSGCASSAPSRCCGSMYWWSLPSAALCASASASCSRVVNLSKRMVLIRMAVQARALTGQMGARPPHSRLLPALRRGIVGGARLDPALPRLLLPEGRLRLQEIHDEFAGPERVGAMGRRHGDHHDLVGRLEGAAAVDDGAAEKLPATARLVHDLAERL